MKIDVLDNGYVKFIEAWGHGLDGENTGLLGNNDDNEVGIIEAARQSTQGSFRGWENGDEKLLGFMAKNHHTTPFEFSGLVLEVKLPIIAAREWIRHRTQGYNEMSARYAPLPNENYVPTLDRLFLTQEKNKQAQAVEGAPQLTEENANIWLANLVDFYENAEALYQEGLSIGIPKEVARIVLPVGRYTQWRCVANLHNWFNFLRLRSTKSNPNAQWEIRQFADAVETIIAEKFPRSYKLFDSQRK